MYLNIIYNYGRVVHTHFYRIHQQYVPIHYTCYSAQYCLKYDKSNMMYWTQSCIIHIKACNIFNVVI